MSHEQVPDTVRDMRTQHGLSMEALAKHCALSIRQLRQIEEGGHDAFYSPAIKALAARKVLSALQDADGVLRTQQLAQGTAPAVWNSRVLQFRSDTYKATRPARGV